MKRTAEVSNPLAHATRLFTYAHMAMTALSGNNRVALQSHKIGFYMVPDIAPDDLVHEQPYASCRRPKTAAMLQKMKTLLPEVQLRWDNELGHANNTMGFVESMVQCANASNIPIIITASATDGYDNFWANKDAQPTVSIEDIAQGPYLAGAHTLLRRYPNISTQPCDALAD